MVNGIDKYDDNSDWLHTKWRLPDYKTRSFFSYLSDGDITLAQFQRTQMYLTAVSTGLIKDDEWTGVQPNWSEPWLRPDVDFEVQVEVRLRIAKENIIAVLADAQAAAGRGLIDFETGSWLLEYFSNVTAGSMSGDDVKLADADLDGIEDLEKVDQRLAWWHILAVYSDFMKQEVLKKDLPQIWRKKDARAVYYPDRNLIVVPSMAEEQLPLLVHAGAHYIESLGRNREAVEMVRNNLAEPGKLHLIRNNLYGLRGPWLDQMDGALRGHDLDWLEEQYISRREFTSKEIQRYFAGRPTEFLAMTSQRLQQQDPIELSNLWSRCPNSILVHLAVSSGSFMEDTDVA